MTRPWYWFAALSQTQERFSQKRPHTTARWKPMSAMQFVDLVQQTIARFRDRMTDVSSFWEEVKNTSFKIYDSESDFSIGYGQVPRILKNLQWAGYLNPNRTGDQPYNDGRHFRRKASLTAMVKSSQRGLFSICQESSYDSLGTDYKGFTGSV